MRFCSSFKSAGRCGTFEEDLQRCMSRGRHNKRDMFIRDVGRSGRRFPERACILERPIFRFAKMVLRDRCSPSYDLASLFRQARYFRQMEWNNHKTHWHKAASSTLNFPNFPFLKDVSQNCYIFDVVNFEKKLRMSCRIPLLLTLSSSKSEEVSQRCLFVCCQEQKMRKYRRIASFSSLRIDN